MNLTSYLRFCLCSALLVWCSLPILAQETEFEFIDTYNHNSTLSELINYIRNYNPESPYSDSDEANCNYSIVRLKGRYGIYNTSTKSFFAEPKYDSVTPVGNVLVKKKWSNLMFGDEISERIGSNPQGIVFIRRGKHGIKSITGKILLEPVYDEIIAHCNRSYFSLRKKERWGLYSLPKQTLIKPAYDYIVTSNYIDRIVAYKDTARTILFDDGRPYSEDNQNRIAQKRYITYDPDFGEYYPEERWKPVNRLVYEYGDKYGVEDTSGKQVVPHIYAYIKAFQNKTFMFKKDGLYGLLDNNGNVLIHAIYHSLTPIADDEFNELYLVRDEEGPEGLISTHGLPVVPNIIENFDGAFRTVQDGKNVYWINCRMSGDEKNISHYYNGEKLAYSAQALLKYSSGEIMPVLVNCQSIWRIEDFGYAQYILFTDLQGKSGLYNLSSGHYLKPQYKAIIAGDKNRFAAKKGDQFDTLIDSLFNERPLPVPAFAFRWGHFLLKGKDGMKIMDQEFSISKYSYPKIEFVSEPSNGYYYPPEDVKWLSGIFKYYTTAEGNQKHGIIDASGNIIIKAGIYDAIQQRTFKKENVSNEKLTAIKPFDEHVLIARTNKKTTTDDIDLYTLQSKIASFEAPKSWEFSHSFITRNHHLPIRTRDSVVLYNLNTKKIDLQVKGIDFTEATDGSYIITVSKNGQRLFYMYDCKAKLTGYNIFAGYERSVPQNPELIVVRKNKYGVIRKGEELIPFTNDTLYNFNYGRYISAQNGLYGIIGTDNEILTPFEYTAIEKAPNTADNSGGILFLLKNGENTGLANPLGRQVVPAKYTRITYSFDTAIGIRDSVHDVYTLKGRHLFSVICDSLINTHPHFKFYRDNKQGLIDRGGKMIKDAVYDRISARDDIFIAKDDNKLYLQDQDGNLRIPFAMSRFQGIYSDGCRYEKKFYAVSPSGLEKVGLFSENYLQLLPYEYEAIDHVVLNKYVMARKSGKYGVVDMNNKIIIPFRYKRLSYSPDMDYYEARDEEKNYKIAFTGVILEIEE